jgi:hypothetical protein
MMLAARRWAGHAAGANRPTRGAHRLAACGDGPYDSSV